MNSLNPAPLRELGEKSANSINFTPESIIFRLAEYETPRDDQRGELRSLSFGNPKALSPRQAGGEMMNFIESRLPSLIFVPLVSPFPVSGLVIIADGFHLIPYRTQQ